MAFTPGNNNGTSNGSTAVDVVASPSAGFRLVRTITLHQTGSTARTSVLSFNDGSNTRTILRQELQPNESIVLDNVFVVGTTDSIELTLTSAAGTTSVQFTAHYADET